jgi:uncharacterized membrane protein
MASKQNAAGQDSGRPSRTGSKAGRSKSGSAVTASGAASGSTVQSGSAGPRNPASPRNPAGQRNTAGQPGSAGRRNPAGQRNTANGRGGRPQGRDRQRPGPAPAVAAGAERPAPPWRSAPRWLQLTTFVLSLAGLGVSIWLTIAHFTSSSLLLCPSNSFVNCGEVTSSPESMVFGVFPVAVLGLAFYVFLVAINSPWAWRSPRPQIRWARIGSMVVGMGFVLYLVYAELIQIGKLCEYCTAVHVITFLLFIFIVFNATAPAQTTAGKTTPRR